MRQLNEILADGAIKMHGCKDGVKQIGTASSKMEMLDCFFDRIDFCLARNYPHKDSLKANFGDLARQRGIYIDEQAQLHNTHAVLLGDCDVHLHADAYSVCRLHVKHNSRLTIHATGHAFVMVDTLDNCTVNIICEEDAKVAAFMYADSTIHWNGHGTVKIIHKNRTTYEL